MRSSEKMARGIQSLKYNNLSSHEKGNGVETEGESNNYGIVDLNI